MLMFTTFIASAVISSSGSYVVGLRGRARSRIRAGRGGRARGRPAGRERAAAERGDPDARPVHPDRRDRRDDLGQHAALVPGRVLAPRLQASAARRLLFTPNDTFIVLVVIAVAAALALLFRATSLGLRMRAAAFAPEVARLLGVRVGRMLTLGWALAAMVGSLAGVLVAPSVFLGPNSFDPILIIGFVAAVLGGLDSPPGAVVGGIVLGLGAVVRVGLRGLVAGAAGGARDPRDRADDPPDRPVLRDPGAAGVSSRALAVFRGSTLLRSLALVVVAGVVLLLDQRFARAPTATSSSPTAPTTSACSPG